MTVATAKLVVVVVAVAVAVAVVVVVVWMILRNGTSSSESHYGLWLCNNNVRHKTILTTTTTTRK